MTDVRWDLLQPVNVPGLYQQSYEHAQQNALQQQEVAYQQRERARGEQLRNALTGAINPTTGSIDYGAVRRAYIGAGDVQGAIGVETARDTQLQRQLAQHRDRIIQGAQFLQGVTDQATYSQRRQMAAQAGIDVSDVPEQYDPAYVQGIVQIAARLQDAAHPREATNIQREVDYYRSIGRPEMADQLLQRHAEGPPSVVRNDDGTFTVVPPSVTHPAQGPQNLPRPTTPEERARLAPGQQYIAPDGSVRTVPGGAPQPQAAGTFPG